MKQNNTSLNGAAGGNGSNSAMDWLIVWIVFIVLILINALVIWVLWNGAAVPAISTLRPIDYLQAIGIKFLADALF